MQSYSSAPIQATNAALVQRSPGVRQLLAPIKLLFSRLFFFFSLAEQSSPTRSVFRLESRKWLVLLKKWTAFNIYSPRHRVSMALFFCFFFVYRGTYVFTGTRRKGAVRLWSLLKCETCGRVFVFPFAFVIVNVYACYGLVNLNEWCQYQVLLLVNTVRWVCFSEYYRINLIIMYKINLSSKCNYIRK